MFLFVVICSDQLMAIYVSAPAARRRIVMSSKLSRTYMTGKYKFQIEQPFGYRHMDLGIGLAQGGTFQFHRIGGLKLMSHNR